MTDTTGSSSELERVMASKYVGISFFSFSLVRRFADAPNLLSSYGIFIFHLVGRFIWLKKRLNTWIDFDDFLSGKHAPQSVGSSVWISLGIRSVEGIGP